MRFQYLNFRYTFIEEELPLAHKSAQEAAEKACEENQNIVVIDNTNVTGYEVGVYTKIAAFYNYITIVVTPNTPWRLNSKILSKKNVHNVKLSTIKKRHKRWQDAIPIYYGFFINHLDSATVLTMAQSWLERCLAVSEFVECLDIHSKYIHKYEVIVL